MSSQLSSSTETEGPVPIDALIEETATDMEAVNAMILSRADSHVTLVPEISRYLIEAGGKRLRPMLTVAAAHILGKPSGNQISYAAAIEFMHNATLLHDDVVDESDMRRGRPAARKVWGNQASVLVGDFLLGQAFMMMVDAGDLGALKVLSRAAAVMAEGEVLQLSKAGDPSTTEADYMNIISAKTATLFEAATEVGAMAGGGEPTDVAAMAKYGRALGLAFQLVDDCLDYGGASGDLGKNTGDDLREGKMTLPVILTLQTAAPNDRALLLQALGDADLSDDTLHAVQSIIKDHGALETTMNRATKHAKDAQQALQTLPSSPLNDILAGIAIYCVERAT